MSSIRIKVQVGDDEKNYSYQEKYPLRKFVYPIDSPSHKTINELIRILQEYIIQKFSYTNIKIVQLMIDDGFILCKSDLCSTVLKDNDQIICVNMKKFIEEYYKIFKDNIIWLELKQHDASDNREKYIHIGVNNVSELFIRMQGTTGVVGLYIFGIYELMTIANEQPKDNLIARLDSTNDSGKTSSTDWFLETKWEYDTVSNKDLFIICNLKVGSNDEVNSNKLHILLDHSRMRIEKGDIIRLSGEINDGTILTDEQRQRLQELAAKLPSPKRTGPQINLKTNENLKLTKYECEGESSIRMAYGNTNTVTAFQAKYSREDGTTCQYFVITHIIFSKKPLILPEILQQKRSTPVDKPVSVANLTVLYQTHDEGWRECCDIVIAPVPTRDEEPKWLTNSVINIEPDKLISFTIKGWILVKGEAARDHQTGRRIHKNLPQPLKLKILVTDNFGKQCSLIVEQINKPLELVTRESFLKTNQSSINELLAFIYADDCETDDRIYMTIYINKDNALVIKLPNAISYIYERKALRTMEYNAKQNKVSEVPLDQTRYQYQTDNGIAIALFDPETYIFYATRLELSTKTSKTEETVFIPMEKIN